MPILSNHRHELFAQELAKGKSLKEACGLSGTRLQSIAKPAGYYVYLLVDSRTDVPFYVGKGKNRRAFAHVAEWRKQKVSNAAKYARICDIHAAGFKVRHYCLQDGLSEDEAFSLERELISRLSDKLTN